MLITLRYHDGVRMETITDVKSISYHHNENKAPVWVFIRGELTDEGKPDTLLYEEKELVKCSDIACIDGWRMYWLKRNVTQAAFPPLVTD